MSCYLMLFCRMVRRTDGFGSYIRPNVTMLIFFLASMNTDNHVANSNMLCLKVAPLKFNVFARRLFLNHIPTKDNLLKRGVI